MVIDTISTAMPLIQIVDVASPAPLNLRAMRGEVFELDLTYGVGTEDFSANSFRMNIVVEKNQTGVAAITELTNIATVGSIVGGANRAITVRFPSVATAQWPERLCEYQIEMGVAGEWQPIIAGKLPVKKNLVT